MARDHARSWWDRLAWAYDLQVRLERPALDTAVRLACVRPDDRVLDVGCGTGQWMRRLAAIHVAPSRLVGLDQSQRMLERARATRAEVVRGDVRDLPFADASFDVVSVAYVLHLLADADLPIALSEIHRVLSPEGRCVSVTPWAAPGWPGRLQGTIANRLSQTRWSSMGGLRPLDPGQQFKQVGFTIDATVDVVRGYGSRCVRALVEPR